MLNLIHLLQASGLISPRLKPEALRHLSVNDAGTKWEKIGGKTVPMACAVYLSNPQNVLYRVGTRVKFNDYYSSATNRPTMANFTSGSEGIIIEKPNRYSIIAGSKWESVSTGQYDMSIVTETINTGTTGYSTSGAWPGWTTSLVADVNQFVYLNLIYWQGASYHKLRHEDAWANYLQAIEVPSW